MDKAHKSGDSECCTPSSEPFLDSTSQFLLCWLINDLWFGWDVKMNMNDESGES
jgi:hypothetical protein